MAGIDRVNGGVGIEGKINGDSAATAAGGKQLGASIRFFKIAVINGSSAAVDLQGEMATGINGGLGLGVEAILRVVPSGLLAYYVPADTSGFIYIAVDGHAAFAASTSSATQPGLQEMIRALGASVGSTPIDVSLSTVTGGSSFTVA